MKKLFGPHIQGAQRGGMLAAYAGKTQELFVDKVGQF
jgi:hypothetical protein